MLPFLMALTQIMVKNLEKEISALKRELAMHDTFASGKRSHVSYEPLSQQQRYEISQQVEQYVNGQLDEIDVSEKIVPLKVQSLHA